MRETDDRVDLTELPQTASVFRSIWTYGAESKDTLRCVAFRFLQFKFIFNNDKYKSDEMINATIFKSAFVSLVLLSCAMARPTDLDTQSSEAASEIDVQSKPKPKPTTTTTARPLNTGDHFDQRQNGTKNFRIHVDGVVLVVAPAEALLLAGELDPSLLGIGQGGSDESSKPDVEDSDDLKSLDVTEIQKQVKRKSAHSHRLRLSSVLEPLLRRWSS